MDVSQERVSKNFDEQTKNKEKTKKKQRKNAKKKSDKIGFLRKIKNSGKKTINKLKKTSDVREQQTKREQKKAVEKAVEKQVIYYPLQKKTSFWRILGVIIFIILILDLLTAVFYKPRGNVALIPIEGVITTTGSSFLQTANSEDIVDLIMQAAKNPRFKAIVIEINSPGGSAVASEEIARAVEQAKKNKTVVAWIRDIGTSGAYWIASSSDWIIASKASITGSIGVKGSYIEIAGLLERYNATYQELASGEFKEMGNPFKHLTDTERYKILRKLGEIHEYFKQVISKNRNLSESQLSKVANGEFFTGIEAKDLGLIDQIGGELEVKSFLEQKGIAPRFEKMGVKKSFMEMLKQVFNKPDFNTCVNQEIKGINKMNPLALSATSNYFIIEAR